MKKILDDMVKSYGIYDSVSRLQNWHEEALKAARGLNITEIMEQELQKFSRGYDNISQIAKTSQLALDEAGKQFNNSTYSHTLNEAINNSNILAKSFAKNNGLLSYALGTTSKQIESAKTSTSELIKQLTGSSLASKIDKQYSAFAEGMKLIDSSALASMIKELEISKYIKLLQPEFFETLRDQDDVEEEALFVNTKDEIVDNLSSNLDFKNWSKKAIKIFLAILFLLEFINTSVEFYKNMDYLLNYSKDIETEEQVDSLVKEASKKFDIDDLVDYRVAKGDGLHLREHPNTEATIIEKLPIGKFLYIIDDSQPYWLKVEVQLEGSTFKGWVSKRFTRKFQ